MTTFTNPKRVCGRTTEGHGEYATVWRDYEILCPDCERWRKDYGEFSRQVGDDPDVQEWICGECASPFQGDDFFM